MRRTIVLGCCAALLPSPALASVAAPALPPGEICVPDQSRTPAERVIDPMSLIRWLIAAGPVGDAALDADGDGDTLLLEKQLAFTQPGYCAAPGRNCTAADAASIRRLHDRLADFVRTQGGAYYGFERLRQPDAVDRTEVPALDPAFEVAGQPFQVGEMLHVPARYVRIVCRDQPLPAPPAIADATTPGPSLPDRWVRDPDGLEGFRLTGSIDDLSREGTRLSSVHPATFSIDSDLKAGTRTYFIDLVAGYDFEFAKGDEYDTSIIPFATVNRLFRDTGSEINKVGAGVQAATATRGGPLGHGEIALTPLYLTDTRLSSDIGTLNSGGRRGWSTRRRYRSASSRATTGCALSSSSTCSRTSATSSTPATTRTSGRMTTSCASAAGSAFGSAARKARCWSGSSSASPTAISTTSTRRSGTSTCSRSACPICSRSSRTTGCPSATPAAGPTRR